MTKRLDLVLPAYKPHAGWEQYALARIQELQSLRPQWQIHLYISPDGSRSGHESDVRTRLEQALSGRLTYVEYERNRGKGYALRSAVARTSADYVLYTDWDFPFTTESYLLALDALEMGAEVVLPVRATDEYTAKLSPIRHLLSSGSRGINRLLLALPSNDTQGGIKAFNARGRELFLSTQIDRFLFDTEFIALSTKKGLDIRLTECHIRPEIVLSRMSWSTLKGELRYIPRLICARWFS